MSNVKAFGAVGDGQTDDTDAIRHAISSGDGRLRFPRGDYRITSTLEIPLDEHGRTSIHGDGTATLVMSGAGPAIRLIGTHQGTGDPGSVTDAVWQRQRMPCVRGLEVKGDHPEADGIELIGTMQAIIEGVLIRRVCNGIRLTQRNRNVEILDSHVYHNTGVGVLLHDVNLHQINICGNHISYNRLGGIRIERSEVRNLQITGNDIEYNNHRAFETEPEPTAEIFIDTTAERASVNEVTIASNTIQATVSPGGCNIRVNERRGDGRPPGLWSITGNIIGNQETNVHLTGCHGFVISGNCIYSCAALNVLLENCTQINLTGNNFRRHMEQAGTGIRIAGSKDCIFSGCQLQDEAPDGQSSGAPLLELEECERVTVQGVQLLDGAPWGLRVRSCRDLNFNGCYIGGKLYDHPARGAAAIKGAGLRNLMTGTHIQGKTDIDNASDLRMHACIVE